MSSVLQTRTRLIQTNGVRLHAETAGPVDGPLVILLHGFPEFWYGMLHPMRALAEAGCSVVALDQRGYNGSEKPRGTAAYDVEMLAADVVGVIDFYGRQQAVIVGHDWGGLVAWQVAMQYPQRVARLAILNAPHPAAYLQALRSPKSGQALRSLYIYFFQLPILPELLLRGGNCWGLKNLLRRSSNRGTFSSAEMKRYQEAWRRPGAVTAMLNWYRAAVRRALRKGPSGYVQASQVRVPAPTLILWGEQDVALTTELAQSSLDWCMDGRLVRFPTASHWVQHDQPQAVGDELRLFVKPLLG